MNVHVLAKVRDFALIKSALLLFKTARVGFPKNRIIVHGNNLERGAASIIARACDSIGAEFIPTKVHVAKGAWIETLLANERGPFWICDTDMVFFEDVSQWFAEGDDVLFAGRHEPEYWESWTKTIHVARLHPSLMWFNANKLRAAMRSWLGLHEMFRTAETELIRWSFVPRDGKLYLHDVCSGLFHALGGTQFTEQQNEAFSHLFCGSYHDLVKGESERLKKLHESVFNDPESARGLFESQRQWYKEHREEQNKKAEKKTEREETPNPLRQKESSEVFKEE